jgi:prolyl-tRNA editing enzyme YbaK/EbsC (Cys-tRNA(Pro) deacylase)
MFTADALFQVSPTQMDLQDKIKQILAASGLAHEILPCDPALADTATFCAHYGYAPEISANAILVKSKTGERKFAVCIVLATTRLDVNKVVRKKLGARKVSFADAAETSAMTGMEIGGVTPIGLPPELPVWVDARIMACDSVILGGGDRSHKIVVDPKFFEQSPNTEIVADLAKGIPQEQESK